jgi:hypothetical protein
MTAVFDKLRAELDARGLTPFDVQLPGEKSSVTPLEGALRLRRTDDGGFILESVDYGNPTGWARPRQSRRPASYC